MSSHEKRIPQTSKETAVFTTCRKQMYKVSYASSNIPYTKSYWVVSSKYFYLNKITKYNLKNNSFTGLILSKSCIKEYPECKEKGLWTFLMTKILSNTIYKQGRCLNTWCHLSLPIHTMWELCLIIRFKALIWLATQSILCMTAAKTDSLLKFRLQK